MIGEKMDLNLKMVVEKERWAYHFLGFSLARNKLRQLCKRTNN
jgi:hypothetical protein